MGRDLRSLFPGAPTHITARGVDEQPIFLSDLDRYELLGIMRRTSDRMGLDVLCWCLMTTHYHFLVVVPDDVTAVAAAMHRINSTYARRFNAWHRRHGHVFGERYRDTVVETDPHGHRTIAYILDNPGARGDGEALRRVELVRARRASAARRARRRRRGGGGAARAEESSVGSVRDQERVMAAEKKPRAAKTTKKAETTTKPKAVRARKPKTTTPTITPEHIAERAYYIWAEGSDGDAFAHWIQAERELTAA
ncbi:MAG: transposase [Gaiellaceae bacterium]